MPETDPVIAALNSVDDGASESFQEDDEDEPGSRAHDQLGADVEAPGADVDDPLAEIDDEEESGFSIRSWARRVPEGSHRDFDRTDWFDLEGGGENRIAFHLSDALGDHGEGPYPNALGTVVGGLEAYIRLMQGKIETPILGLSGGSDDEDADTGGMY